MTGPTLLIAVALTVGLSGCSPGIESADSGDRVPQHPDAWLFEDMSDSDWGVVVLAKRLTYYLVRHPLGLLLNLAYAGSFVWSARRERSRLPPAMQPPFSHYLRTYAVLVSLGVVGSALFGTLRVLVALTTLAVVALALAMLGGGGEQGRYWYWVDTRTGKTVAPDVERNRMESESRAREREGQEISNRFRFGELTVYYAVFVTLGLLSQVWLFDGWLIGAPAVK